jgi:hypothetical protein
MDPTITGTILPDLASVTTGKLRVVQEEERK